MASPEHMRRIPSVDGLLGRESQAELLARWPRELVVSSIREGVAELREALGVASDDEADALLAPEAVDGRIAGVLEARLRPSLVPVLNATGVVIHTNLGRSPTGAAVLDAVRRVAAGYCNLEYDLAEGRRGSRHVHLERLFRELTGAEAALVVNNNAGAVLLILSALARDREVIVSRGELIEIGGSFRLPDIMAVGGARLREVGTTNRTRAADYEAAMGPETALLLKAHRSNFAIVGFTESPDLRELVELGHRHGVPVVMDQGSGSLVELALRSGGSGADDPVWVGGPLAAGADLVCFSGDKLLGGPQCGIVLGARRLVAKLRAHSLTRALRVDKLTIAALEATVRCYVDGSYREALPAVAALTASEATLDKRARRLAQALAELGVAAEVEVVPGVSAVGGGSLPETELPTRMVSLRPARTTETALEKALRAGSPAVVARIGDGRVLFDVRTLTDAELPVLASAVVRALEPRPT